MSGFNITIEYGFFSVIWQKVPYLHVGQGNIQSLSLKNCLAYRFQQEKAKYSNRKGVTTAIDLLFPPTFISSSK